MSDIKAEVRVVRSATGVYVHIKIDGRWILVGKYNTMPFARKIKAALEKGWEP